MARPKIFLGAATGRMELSHWTVPWVVAALLLSTHGVGLATAGELIKKIVTMTPALGEIVVALDEGSTERIVGVSESSDFPPVLQKKLSIGPYDQVSLERVVAAKPDLVLASKAGNSRTQVERLESLGLRVHVVSTTDFESTQMSFKSIGKLINREKVGKALAQKFEDELKSSRLYLSQTKPRTVLVVGEQPTVVVGGKGFIGEALRHLGAINCYESASNEYPRPSQEDLLEKNPDRIAILAMGTDVGFAQRILDHWKAYRNLKAVREGRIGILQIDELMRPTPRLPQGVLKLGRWLNGETVTQANTGLEVRSP